MCLCVRVFVCQCFCVRLCLCVVCLSVFEIVRPILCLLWCVCVGVCVCVCL